MDELPPSEGGLTPDQKKISELQSQVRMYEELMRGFKDQIDKLDLLQVVKPPSADDASPYS